MYREQDGRFDSEQYDLIELSLGGWFNWIDYGEQARATHHKILVPLDRSLKAAEGVLGVVQDILEPDGEGILLHVIPPQSTKMSAVGFMSEEELEKLERSRALGYLNYYANRLNQGTRRWRPEVAVSSSVADCIKKTAVREDVDLIAMYTHERKGLARLIKGSVTSKVKDSVPTEVRVVRPSELAAR